jgi:glyoxylase-like metal-dependent hydrolase (beta-lactamase superfamily II)
MGRKFGYGLVTIAALAFSIAGAASAADEGAEYAPLKEPIKFEQVPGADIYYTIGNTGIPTQANQGNTSNAGYVLTDQGVVVFDALGTPSLGWAMLQDIRKRNKNDVRYIVMSHYHADHIYGLQAFRDHTDAIIVAQERSSEYSEKGDNADDRAGSRLDQRKDALAPWVNEKTRIVPPDITFNDRMSIALGSKTFSLFYAGPAHSSNDIMMMVEPDGVLFTGDIVQNGRVPFVNSDDVNSEQWVRALNEVLKRDPKYIIPGHGKPSVAAKEAISFTRDYLTYVRAAMEKAVANWTDFETAYAQTDWSKYKDLPAFENNNKGNAYRIFLEVEASQFKK